MTGQYKNRLQMAIVESQSRVQGRNANELPS